MKAISQSYRLVNDQNQLKNIETIDLTSVSDIDITIKFKVKISPSLNIII